MHKKKTVESCRAKIVAAERKLWNKLKTQLKELNANVVKDAETSHFEVENRQKLASLVGLFTATAFVFEQSANDTVMGRTQAVSTSAAFNEMARILTEITPDETKKLSYLEILDRIYTDFIDTYSATVRSRLAYETRRLSEAAASQMIITAMSHEPKFNEGAVLQYL